MKNGHTYISIVDAEEFVSGLWNPYNYRHTESESRLVDFATVKRVDGRKNSNKPIHEPIEYRDLPSGLFLTFSLTRNEQAENGVKYPCVGEQALLFGTMRAYLGNVVVTPKGDWISEDSISFSVKSEFVQIIPFDGLVYFWWSYLKSPDFLNMMPTGDGGTRPRASADALSGVSVVVPPLAVRQQINEQLLDLAEKAWTNYARCMSIVSGSNLDYEHNISGTN